MRIAKNVLVLAMASLFALSAAAQQGEQPTAPRPGQRLEMMRQRMGEMQKRMAELQREAVPDQVPGAERPMGVGPGRKGPGRQGPGRHGMGQAGPGEAQRGPGRGPGRGPAAQGGPGRGPREPMAGRQHGGPPLAILLKIRERLRQALHHVDAKIAQVRGGRAVAQPGRKQGPQGGRGRRLGRRGEEA